MTFRGLIEELRETMREQVRNGYMTERNLARLTGVSQPQLHNVLKGIRVLTPELADQIMRVTGILLSELGHQINAGTGTQSADAIPKRHPRPAVIPGFLSGIIPFGTMQSPAFISLTDDPRMSPRFQASDVVLFEESAIARTELDSSAAYLVNYDGRLLVRYVRMGGKRLYLVAEDSLADPLRWDFVSIRDGNILEIVRGRIVWICRQMETRPPSPLETAGRKH